MESPDNKEEKYELKGKQLKFFSVGKIIKLFLWIFGGLFAVFGLLAFVNLTLYPDMGIIDLAKERTSQWRSAKESDLGHEAISFELMLDAYADKGGDISHAMDTLTDEFTFANWAELLEYDVDYFLKHDEIADSVKTMGMLHVTKTLYRAGHYDLFKEGYKTLVNEFAAPNEFTVIYTELLPLKAMFDFDDDEEEEELARLYELELRRHLKMTAVRIVHFMRQNQVSDEALSTFVQKLGVLANDEFISQKSEQFRVQLGSDLSHILTLIDQQAATSGNTNLAKDVEMLRMKFQNQNLEYFDENVETM
jgi:hypothetical protein